MGEFLDLELFRQWHAPNTISSLSAIALILGIWVLRWLLDAGTSVIQPTAPIIGLPKNGFVKSLRARLAYVKSGYKIIFDGFRNYPDTFFRVPADQNILIIPPRFIDELKSQPRSILNPTNAVADYFLGEYTTLDVTLSGRTVFNATRKHLQQDVNTKIVPLLEECSFAFEQEMPTMRGQSAITLHPFILQVIARMNARIFVGKDLCRNPRWLHVSSDFSTCIFLGSATLKMFPSFLRPIAAFLNPYIRRIRQHRKVAQELLIPEIRRRNMAPLEKTQPHHDMLQWITELSEGDELAPERIVDRELGLGFAATHGTTNLIVNAIYDLAARWDDYASQLHEESDSAFEGDHESIAKSISTKLPKLDSFIKESQRMNPGSALSFHRKVKAPHVLSDGTTLQPSTYLAIASGPLAMSKTYHSVPEAFDGLRFYRSRQNAGRNNASTPDQFASTGVSSLMFGHGRHACPGRFFAGLEAKIVIAHILRFYDLSLKQATSRPQNLIFADANLPDQSVVVCFQKRHR